MPKIRGVKPDFWTDKNIVILSPLARLLYIGMWNYAADCGHLEDEPIELKMRILPADNCDVGELLNELEKGGRITREGGGDLHSQTGWASADRQAVLHGVSRM